MALNKEYTVQGVQLCKHEKSAPFLHSKQDQGIKQGPSSNRRNQEATKTKQGFEPQEQQESSNYIKKNQESR